MCGVNNVKENVQSATSEMWKHIMEQHAEKTDLIPAPSAHAQNAFKGVPSEITPFFLPAALWPLEFPPVFRDIETGDAGFRSNEQCPGQCLSGLGDPVISHRFPG